MTARPVRLRLEYGQTLLELLADLDLDAANGQLPLLDGEAIGARRFTPIERLAVDQLRAEIRRIQTRKRQR